MTLTRSNGQSSLLRIGRWKRQSRPLAAVSLRFFMAQKVVL